MAGLFKELKRRNVFRVGMFYLIAGWLVLQVTDVLAPALRLPDWTTTLVAFLVALGLPVVLVLAWAYELTPEGVKRESDVDRSRSITADTGKKLNLATLVVAALAIVLMVMHQFRDTEPERIVETRVQTSVGEPSPSPAPESGPAPAPEPVPEPAPSDRSIAVLPFDDFSAAGDQAHFSNGLADTILHMLAQVDGLRVAARTSSFAFKDVELDVQTIGQRLNVATVLEGSVQKAGNRIRVIAQLIDVANGAHLWSQTFDRDLDDIFAVQDEIARSVADALAPDTSESLVGAGTDDPAAYELYLKAREAMRGGTSDHWVAADDWLRQAIAVDPEFAEAHAALALNFATRGDMGFQQRLELRLPLIERSLELDPDLALGHALMGEALYARVILALDGFAPDEMALIESELGRAVEINPNLSWAWAEKARYLRATRRWQAALPDMVKAIAIDPLHPRYRVEYARTLHRLGRFDDARAEIETALRIDPTFIEALDEMARLEESAFGRPDRAIAWARLSQSIDPDSTLVWLREAFAVSYFRDPERLQALIGEMVERGDPYVDFVRTIQVSLYGTLEELKSRVAETDDAFVGAYWKPLIAYREGDLAATLEALRSVVDDATVGGETGFDTGNAALSAYLLTRTGRIEEGRALARRVLDEAEGRPLLGESGAGRDRLVALTVLGEREQARELIDELLEAGFIYSPTDRNQMLTDILGDDYERLVAPARERQAELYRNLDAALSAVRDEYEALKRESLLAGE